MLTKKMRMNKWKIGIIRKTKLILNTVLTK